MLKKTITYTDFNDVERTEDLYFNLTKTELMEMEMTTPGGYADYVQSIINAKDVPTLVMLFKELLLKAYGEKSADGKRFVKNDEIREAFSQSAAYDVLYMELVTDDKKAADFMNGIIPKIETPNAAKILAPNA